MSYDNQSQPDHQVVNPSATHTGPTVVQYPAEVYATKDEAAVNSQYMPPPPPGETKSKGDGFWRGCCAGWCCYCCLDICF